MNYVELLEQIVELADDLSSAQPNADMSGVIHLVEHGEPEEGLDLLIAIVVKLDVPVTSSQQELLRALVRHFGESNREQAYSYLDDPEMLDRVTVVDGHS